MNSILAQQLLRGFVVIAISTVSILFVYLLFPYIYPILIAFCLSCLLHPFITLFEKKLKMPRLLALISTLMVFISFLTLSFLFLISEFYQGIVYLSDKLPFYFDYIILQAQNFIHHQFVPFYTWIISFFNTLDLNYQIEITNYLEAFTQSIRTGVTVFFQKMLQQIGNVLVLLPNSFTISIFIILATFMISYDLNNIQSRLLHILPDAWNSTYKKITHHLKIAVIGYFKAQFILVCISAVLLFVGLHILDIEHAFTIVLFAAVADFIPYLGIGIILVPWILFSFFTLNYPLTIGLSIIYGVIILIRQFIEPKIVATSIGISPLIMLIGMFLGIQWFGVFGLILSPVILVILLALKKAGLFSQLIHYIKGNHQRR